MASRLQKSVLLAATFLILATVVGAAFAMWSETLRINIIVVTGEVDVEWSDYWHNDTYEKPDLDVTTVNITEEEYEDSEVIKLKVEINNAYPCYKVAIFGVVDNIGTIPVKRESAKIIYDATEKEIDLDTWYQLDLNNDNLSDIEVLLKLYEDGGDGSQIDPGYNDTYMLVIHVLQEALENHTYTFELQLTFAQWNEVE
ncbi:MAG: hypothetical protein B6U85_10000 [Desulfurococcales archaeon ex4484_42]|nr:MAG: hypothetical protein B6U85_10000 [Desulfurococcales archaeon ex4484_42]